ncbi:hypothetical protein V5O48_013801 [Marasmius crinis-equi]|uniref:F-box domain-containing protein n=1 Tax=Marasmius crinis-equi TaxID=585013 RepID=A0ABR3EZ35_9AGAR
MTSGLTLQEHPVSPKQWNSKLPVSKLHTELLVKIFLEATSEAEILPHEPFLQHRDDERQCLSQAFPNHHPFPLLALCSVCEGWRTIAICAANLWSRLDLRLVALVPLMLERARATPLTVVHFTFDVIDRSPAVVELVLGRIAQIEGLELAIFPEFFDTILHSIHDRDVQALSMLKVLDLSIDNRDDTGETSFSSLAQLLRLSPNLEELNLGLTLLPPSTPSTSGISLCRLQDLSISTNGGGVEHLHLLNALNIPPTTSLRVYFPVISPETLECLSNLCKSKQITRLLYTVGYAHSLHDLWIDFSVRNDEMSVQLPELVAPGRQILSFLSSFMELNYISSDMRMTSEFRSHLLDLLNTTRLPFPLRSFENLATLELCAWKPATDYDVNFHLDVFEFISIIQARLESNSAIQRLVLSRCSLPNSAQRAFRALVPQVDAVGTDFYADLIFILPSP